MVRKLWSHSNPALEWRTAEVQWHFPQEKTLLDWAPVVEIDSVVRRGQMINRRRVIRKIITAAALPAILLMVPRAARAQSFQRFVPLLIDLQGWKGNKADGLAMEMPGNSMITATRAYERGDARLNAQVIIGPAAQGALAATNANMNLETGDGHIRTSPIDGLQVTRTFTNSNKSGAILVALGPSALFTISF